MLYLGIDPGHSGGAAIVTDELQCVDTLKFGKSTEKDFVLWIREHDTTAMVAMCEDVHSMPKQGVASSFKFGRHYGYIRGVLAALDIRRTFVSSMKWQRRLSCLSGGDKNITKARAQELFPGVKITHAIADALLIATYAQQEDLRRWTTWI